MLQKILSSFILNVRVKPVTKRISGIFVLSVIFYFSFSINLHAQRKCATVFHEQKQLDIDQRTKKDFENWLSSIQKNTTKTLSTTENEDIQVYTIPVVVHVVHKGEAIGTAVNIPDTQIFSQIDILNEDFRRLNADTLDTPLAFIPVAADIGLEFVLAKSDPNGNATTGINRILGSKNSWSALSASDDMELKSMIYWPAEDYLNIWVTDLQNNFLGYATFPETSLPGIVNPTLNRLLDGLVVDYEYLGIEGNTDDFSRGRTATHELGHFFGLRHMDGDPISTSQGCSVDDFVTDTPLARSQAGGCPTGFVSCSTTDMVENFMDYSDDVCMNIFTIGQKDRMRVVVENSPRRLSLTTSPGLVAPSIGVDLAVAKIIGPQIVVCDNIVEPVIQISNFGILDSDIFTYTVTVDNGTPVNFAQTLLAGGATREVSLDQMTLANGQHNLKIEINLVDENISNNTYDFTFVIDRAEDFIPLRQNFENNAIDNGWFVINPDNNITWSTEASGRNGSSKFSAALEAFSYAEVGQEDWLISPLLDFAETAEAGIKFSYSYAQRNLFADKLEVLIADDCNKTFVSVFSKQGSELAVKNQNTVWAPAAEDDWKIQFIDLSDFAGSENVRVIFKFTNDFGNTIFLDDIEFFQSDSPIVETTENEFVIFPNPTNDKANIQINLSERQELLIEVFNPAGQFIQQATIRNAINQTLEYDVSTLPSGIYLIRISSASVNFTKRLVKAN